MNLEGLVYTSYELDFVVALQGLTERIQQIKDFKDKQIGNTGAPKFPKQETKQRRKHRNKLGE